MTAIKRPATRQEAARASRFVSRSENRVDAGGRARPRPWKHLARAAAVLGAAAATWSFGDAAHAVVFTSPSYSYTVPPGVTRIRVRVVGGVGGAGNDFIGTDHARGGAARIINAIVNVTPGDVISGTVGRGGQGGFALGANSFAMGGSGAGPGGNGGGRTAITGGEDGGGGGGGTSLVRNGTHILKAGGGGGGGGGAGASDGSPQNAEDGGSAGAPLSRTNCNTSASGASASYVSSSTGGGSGGGGGGGFTGGAAGTGYAYNATSNGNPSGGGGSCYSNQSGLFVSTPTSSLTSANTSDGRDGADGSVEVVELRPSLTKAFAASAIKRGETVSLTFTLSNPAGAGPQSGLAFTDTLPGGLVLAGAPTTSCGGAVGGTAGGGTVALSGGTLPAGASSCTVTAPVTSAPSQAPASCPNASTTNGAGNVTGLSDNLANAVTDQCLAIRVTPLLTKSFGAATIQAGAATTLTFTLTNPSGAPAQTGLSFTDTLPAGLVLASAPSASQCGGTVNGTAGGNTIALSGGTLAAGAGTCTATASVTTAPSQGAATCPQSSATTNGRANITALSDNLANGVTDQCLAVAPTEPTLTIAKVSQNGTGSFVFHGASPHANGFPADGSYSLATAAANTAVTGAAVTLAAANVATEIAETLPPGWRLASARCEDHNWNNSGNPQGAVIGAVAGSNRLSIPAANLRSGAKLRCTFVNQYVGFTVSGRVFLDDGAGGGMANDGIANGGEGALAGAVRLTDCAATVHAAALTDGTGRYHLPVPTGLAPGAPLCVVQPGPAGHLSTGASAGGTALPSGTTVAAADGSYTYSRSAEPDRIAFAWNGGSHRDLDFGDVRRSTFVANGVKTGPPGGTVIHAHTFTAASAGTVRFDVESETATPPLDGWSAQVFADPGCTGTLQPGATQLYPPESAGVAMAAGAQQCVVVRQYIPATAPEEADNRLTVRARFAHTRATPPLETMHRVDDITTVSSAALSLNKEVRSVTRNGTFSVNNNARRGEILEYRITYTNNGDVPITDLTLKDVTPSYTAFVSATTGDTPATLTDCQKSTPANPPPAAAVPCSASQTSGGTGVIDWQFTGSVPPGGTGAVFFRIQVN